jgi:hypothetical protein
VPAVVGAVGRPEGHRFTTIFDAWDEFSTLLQHPHQRHDGGHDATAFHKIAFQHAGFVKGDVFSWQKIRTTRHLAPCAPGKKLKRLIIHAAAHRDPFMLTRQQMKPVDVTGAFLDADDVLRLADNAEVIFAHVDAYAARIVVKHDRQICRAINI